MYHFQRFFLEKKVIYSMCLFILLGAAINIIPFIMNPNVSLSGGIYATSFYLGEYYIPIISILSYVLPILVYYLVVDSNCNELFMEHMLFSRVNKKKFYLSKMVFIFLASFILFSCFFFTTAIISKILYNVSMLEGTYLSNAGIIGKYQLHNSEITRTNFQFAPIFFYHIDIYCIIKSVLFSLVCASFGVLEYGIIQWTHRYILNYILPVCVIFGTNALFYILKQPFDLLSLLSSNSYVPYFYIEAWIGWIILPILIGIILVILRLKEDKS